MRACQSRRDSEYEDDDVREAHQRGHQLILAYLTGGGEKGDRDYGARVVAREGNFFAEVTDLDKARRGVADVLERLQVIKAKGDSEAATAIFDRFGSRVRTEWRLNIRERAARLKLPNKTAFVFPRLEPILEGETVVDVRLHTDEDLTAQQLRFSRMRLDRRIPE
jgi:dipeptidyl-peptidase-3